MYSRCVHRLTCASSTICGYAVQTALTLKSQPAPEHVMVHNHQHVRFIQKTIAIISQHSVRNTVQYCACLLREEAMHCVLPTLNTRCAP